MCMYMHTYDTAFGSKSNKIQLLKRNWLVYFKLNYLLCDLIVLNPLKQLLGCGKACRQTLYCINITGKAGRYHMYFRKPSHWSVYSRSLLKKIWTTIVKLLNIHKSWTTVMVLLVPKPDKVIKIYAYIYVTGPAKINHVSSKKSLIFSVFALL